MEFQKKLYQISFVILLTGLTIANSTTTFPAYVPVRELAAKAGQSANFTCGTNKIPIIICVWEREGEKKLTININEDAALAGSTPEPGYGFSGPGFEDGFCGLHIKNVKDVDNALWDCKLFTQKGHLFQGNVHVGILKKPNQPKFSTNIAQIKTLIDSEPHAKVSVSCGSYGGQPPPQFKWFIGDDEITETLQKPTENTTDESGNIWVHKALPNYKFTANDNGKLLRCLLVHDALGDNDTKEVSEKINVFFEPKAHSDLVPLFVPTIGKDATLSINISSNPKPQILWNIGDIVISPTHSTVDSKYTAYSLVEVSDGVWACGLLIKNVEEEDLSKIYKLQVRNVYGTKEFELHITSSNPEEVGGGLSAGGIVGLVLGIPALLIIIAIIVVYSRARGLLCFKGDDGTASEKERIDDESGGVGVVGGAVEEKQVSRRLSSRLSAIYENLVAKKKDKATAVEEEGNKEKEKEVTPTTEKEPEKKPEDIVYAELDLINEGTGKQIVRCADDKTEYAEIIGVVPHGTKIDDTKNDKSPNASPKK